VRVFVRACVRVCVCACACMGACMFLCTHVCVCACVCVCVCVCVYVCVCMYPSDCTCICDLVVNTLACGISLGGGALCCGVGWPCAEARRCLSVACGVACDACSRGRGFVQVASGSGSSECVKECEKVYLRRRCLHRACKFICEQWSKRPPNRTRLLKLTCFVYIAEIPDAHSENAALQCRKSSRWCFKVEIGMYLNLFYV